MGRTNPTFRDQLRHLEGQWEAYRRALRYDDTEHFDRLFEHARAHADAAGYLNPADPVPVILVSIALEHERRLSDLEHEIEELRTQLESTDNTGSETQLPKEQPANVDV